MNDERDGYDNAELARWVLTGDPAGLPPKMFEDIENRIVQAIGVAVNAECKRAKEKALTMTKTCKDCSEPLTDDDLRDCGDRCRRCWDKATAPRLFRCPVATGSKHPNGSAARWIHGAYFPLTDLVVNDMGGRGTGKPVGGPGFEWLDEGSK